MKLVMVYAVDGGFFESLVHYAQKILAPSTYNCQLCMLTSGALGTEKAWTAFLRGLSVPTVFLHKDELLAAHPDVKDKLPAVYLEDDHGSLRLLVDSASIDACIDLQSLIDLVGTHAERAGVSRGAATVAQPA